MFQACAKALRWAAPWTPALACGLEGVVHGQRELGVEPAGPQAMIGL